MKKKYLFIIIMLPLLLIGDGIDSAYFKSKALQYFQEAVKIRRHLHQNPELCACENKTSAYIAVYLERLGLEVHTGIAGTGLKAVLRGNKEKPVIGIRADMDALPITEATGLKFRSKKKGIMHACGHDGHMTNVLISAKILSEVKDQIPGTVVFIFQPCEEGGSPKGKPSGAGQMIKEGVLHNPKIDMMLGLHVLPGYPAGVVRVKEGAIMANSTGIYVTLRGKASHGAYPHQGIDAIYASSLAVIQFQSLISRFKNPNDPAVLSIGKIEGGVRSNVIADTVIMSGTIRTFSEKTLDLIKNGVEKILQGLEHSLGITYDCHFSSGGNYVKNDVKMTGILLPLFKNLLGEKNVQITEPQTIAEDFALYSHRIPSLFFFLGVGENMTLHHPAFSIDEESLKYGPLLFCSAALKLMEISDRQF